MTTCSDIELLLPWYVNERLDPDEHATVAEHLETCDACVRALVDWRLIAHSVAEDQPGSAAAKVAPIARASDVHDEPSDGHSPAPPAARAAQNTSSAAGALGELASLVRAQARLVRVELWPASAVVLLLGIALASLGDSDARTILGIIAPLVAAVGVTLACTPDNDPRLEIALASPVSPRTVLLARLALVVGYDLLLALAASAGLALDGGEPLIALIDSWLVPMLFLSTIALLATLVIDAGTATVLAFTMWAARWVVPIPLESALMLILAAIALAISLSRVARPAPKMPPRGAPR